MVYFTTLPAFQTVSPTVVGWTGEQFHFKENGSKRRSLFEEPSRNSPVGVEKCYENLRIVEVAAEIRKKHIQITNLESYG